MRPSTPTARTTAQAMPGMDLIAQRIVKLAEIATLEHLEALLGSQGRRLIDGAGVWPVSKSSGMPILGASEETCLHRRAGVSPSLGGTDA